MGSYHHLGLREHENLMVSSNEADTGKSADRGADQ
jgi:hypothetical protein